MMAPAAVRTFHPVLIGIAIIVGSSTPNVVTAQAPDPIDAAIRDLDDSNYAQRLLAVKVLGESRDSRVVQPLITALGRDQAPSVREQAAVSLGKIRDSRAVEPLISALSDRQEPVRFAAMTALGSIGDPRGIRALVAALDSDVHTSTAAQAALAASGAPAVEALEGALTHRERRVRVYALRVLVRIGDVRREPIFGALLGMLSDSAEYNRAWAARTLGETHDRRAVSPLAARLKDRDADVRSAVATALGTLGDSSAIDALRTAIGDPNLEVRRAAASAFLQLVDIHATDQTAALTALLTDKDSDIRSATARRLGEARWAQAIQPLTATLGGDESPVVRATAAAALGRIGDPLTVRPLAAALSDPDLRVRESAMAALGAIADAAAIDALIGAFSREGVSSLELDPNARYRAVAELIRIGAPAVEPLIAVLQHDNALVRGRAADSLEGINDPRAVEPMLPLLDDDSVWVRIPAARFLVTASRRPAVATKLDAALDNRDLPVVAVVYQYYIRKGRAGTEATLVAALSQHGSRVMAQDFINCGNAALEKAGREWAVQHKYRTIRTSNARSPAWGSAR